jgi:hypothetical protein
MESLEPEGPSTQEALALGGSTSAAAVGGFESLEAKVSDTLNEPADSHQRPVEFGGDAGSGVSGEIALPDEQA